MYNYLAYWWHPHSQVIPSESAKCFKVYYDDQGRDVFVEEYDSDHKLVSCTRLIWGRWNQVKTQRNDTRPLGLWRRWLWRMIERLLAQRSFRRPLWQKVICALFKPDFLIRSERLDAKRNLQEYFLYVYFADGSLAGVEQYLADGTFLSFMPIE